MDECATPALVRELDARSAHSMAMCSRVLNLATDRSCTGEFTNLASFAPKSSARREVGELSVQMRKVYFTSFGFLATSMEQSMKWTSF